MAAAAVGIFGALETIATLGGLMAWGVFDTYLEEDAAHEIATEACRQHTQLEEFQALLESILAGGLVDDLKVAEVNALIKTWDSNATGMEQRTERMREGYVNRLAVFLAVLSVIVFLFYVRVAYMSTALQTLRRNYALLA